jgi:hypothetical protein
MTCASTINWLLRLEANMMAEEEKPLKFSSMSLNIIYV